MLSDSYINYFGEILMKKLYLLLLSMIVLMSISCAFASDTNETMINRDVNVDETITANLENVYVDNITVPTGNGDNSADNTNIISYYDLKYEIEHNIRSGDTFNFTRDYKLDESQIDGDVNRVIVINQDNITINGNGHIIDVGGVRNSAMFNVLGNNVTITNLTFISSNIDIPNLNLAFISSNIDIQSFDLSSSRSQLMIAFLNGFNLSYFDISSSISWKGNNGVMKNCVFFNNSAINGGSLSWMGNNGTIDNCAFINSTASGVGGAIYIGGTNNTMSNCLFAGSKSLVGDVIYADRNRKNLSFINNTFLGEIKNHGFIDGSISNIDVNYLYLHQMLYAYGDIFKRQSYQANLIPLVFKAIMTGGTNDYNGLFKYNVLYDNLTGKFTFNILGHDELRKSSFNRTQDCDFDFLATTSHGDLYRQTICDCDFDYLKSIHIKSNITDLNQVFSEIVRGNYDSSIGQLITRYVSNEQDYDEVVRCRSFGLWFNQDERIDSLETGLKVIFTNKLTINNAPTWTTNNFYGGTAKAFDAVTILGNGSTINGVFNKRSESKWLEMDNANKMIIVDDLTLKGFNTAVLCSKGICYFNNVTFEKNVMDYILDRDWGAGILNAGGAVTCSHCTFKNNYAKNGGAIFNQGYLSLNNCSFEGNTGYGKGNDVCVGDGGIVVVNGKNITGNTDIATFAESMSTTKRVILSILPAVIAFVAGFVTSCLATPVVGMAVGAAVGAALGTAFAAHIISRHYNVEFNRGLTCLFVIGAATASGVLGGWAGAAWSAPSAPSGVSTTFEPIVFNCGDIKWLSEFYTYSWPLDFEPVLPPFNLVAW